MTEPTRVRELLDAIHIPGRKALAKLLPPSAGVLPENIDPKGAFPAAILAALPQYKHSIVGLATERLVLLPKEIPITVDTVIACVTEEYQTACGSGRIIPAETVAKIRKSKTTADYIAKIQATRAMLPFATLRRDVELTTACGTLQGHPDAVADVATTAENPTVLEVKTTSKLGADYLYFVLQLFSYAAISATPPMTTEYQTAMLVLPLQKCVLTFDVSADGWVQRDQFRKLLLEKNAKYRSKMAATVATTGGGSGVHIPKMLTMISTHYLLSEYHIGKHVHKAPTLLETVTAMTPNEPYQIFLSGNKSTHLSVKDADLAAAASYITEHGIKLFVHAPYLLNLSNPGLAETDNWHVTYLDKLLRISATLGARGVVVHVGKHTTQTYAAGVERMRLTLEAILPSATPDCPLLLETPAGQGTETLQSREEYIGFIAGFGSPNIAACVDTCHVFANGHDPVEYLQATHAAGILRLVHYNDSADCCGSKKDRHAMVGMGYIGVDVMTRIAEYCAGISVPMVIE